MYAYNNKEMFKNMFLLLKNVKIKISEVVGCTNGHQEVKKIHFKSD